MSPSCSVHRHAAAVPGEADCQVLLVVEHPQRLDLMRRCVRELLPGCHVAVVDSHFDAVSRVTRMQTHLLVLDLSMDSVLVPALKRLLARASPQSLIHVFDDSMDGASGSGTDCNRPSIVQLRQALVDLADSSFQPHRDCRHAIRTPAS
ncbi:DNA-binding NarL/FixJ family response regulator [Hydrogenophaga palleronii]|uniref:DNA-binding NarL/FixJ family response regulator n=1 Tax=Hydrogenophaga palleronii TaxID=65655 RepID=A0ABU1WU37_9BURK|nr:hypothetical protein [Hydrogenophaga palleronii]MDR7152815.1 DNA-binding NarL/FixJ family response regulator [Hydrogenophaga palleronii]